MDTALLLLRATTALLLLWERVAAGDPAARAEVERVAEVLG